MEITINLLTSRRTHYNNLTFHFLNKIKDENKELIRVNILPSGHDLSLWNDIDQRLSVNYNVIQCSNVLRLSIRASKIPVLCCS